MVGNIKYEKSFAYYIEVELGLDMNKIWNFEKNIVNPYEITKQSNKKVWLYCLEKDYHNDEGGYEITCNNFYNGQRCSYCSLRKIHPRDSFAQWGIDTFGEDFLEKYWSKKNTINPYTIAPSGIKKIWILCQEKDYHNDEDGYEISCNNFHKGNRCGYCKRQYKVHKLDSLGYLYPQIAQMIVNDKRNNVTMEDMYKIAPYSLKKFYFKCDKCGEKSNNKKTIASITTRKFSCEFCSDGIPMTEKFMANILKQLNVNFQTQLNKSTFKWCSKYKYDFYLPILNIIIEVHGLQHYKDSTLIKKTLKEEQENDRLKKELALNNNINNYIIIDCRYSEFNWLKENIIKELSPYFDLTNINWELAWLESQRSLVWEVKRLYDLGYTTKEIAKEMNIDISTVRDYKRKLGIEIENKTKVKEENLLKTKELLKQGYMVKQIAEILNVDRHTISNYKKEIKNKIYD